MASLTISDRPARIALVTAGLSLAGGIGGAFCAAAAVALIAGIEVGSGALVSRDFARLLGLSAAFGAFAGMIGAPVLSWAVLRRVPLGRAAVFTTIGTLAGAVGGELVQPFNPYARTVPGVLVGALLGFIGGGIVARLRTGDSDTAIPAEDVKER
ncbi:MAG: hypothetical protein ACJ796_04760 [Gemmatimonadaceae bacterium]